MTSWNRPSFSGGIDIFCLPSGYLLSLNSLESVLLQPFSLCQVHFKQSVASQSYWDGRTHLSILTARNWRCSWKNVRF